MENETSNHKEYTQAFKPVTATERIHTLDIIRGFSLLGILLVNMFAFNLPLPHIQDLNSWFTDAVDIIWHQRLDIYVQSSFYPLFSMLFGYGIAMQYLKAKRVGIEFYSFGIRRIIGLFVLGILHAVFIWWGDILAMYAFSGLFLLMLIRFRSWILFTFGLVINGLMHILMIGMYMISGIANQPFEAPSVDLQMIENAIAAYETGSWTDAFIQRLNDLSVQMSVGMWVLSLFTIFPYMLIGAAAAKWRLVERSKEFKGLWIFLAIAGIALGLFIKSAPYIFTRTYLLEYLKVFVGGPILAVGYGAAIVIICMIPFAIKVLQPIAYAGRMSLTLYIMQSIIGTLIFYHYGFGLYGQVGVSLATFMAIGIFVFQVLFAELWFMKFQQGPLEMGLKKFTYRK